MDNPRKISDNAKNVANDLLKLGSIQLNVTQPFTWVSGIKSPIYCDNRLVNSDVAIRKNMVGYFVELIQDKFKDVEIIAGVATGGIPLGVLIADRLNLPFIYARQAPKEHGLKKQIEGSYQEGNKVVLIEDHISTGGSSLIAVQALRDGKLDVIGLISIMSYGFSSATEKFEKNDVNHYTLCDLDTVLDISLERGNITENEKASILSFKNSPSEWGNSLVTG